jgi:hypothetical protein
LHSVAEELHRAHRHEETISRAIDCAAVSVSVGTLPFGAVVAANRLLQASAFTLVAQPASKSASVANLAIVGVWPLLSGS